ncbi:unnamed protein product [Protopolystoma xenopodis]|uniref:Uncharacterized protein n=1 Tax=Protopolystoma xenopodis TaxID=117903 RepID=A0A3S5BD32_9PLAT|nr:unnamed protein product [Protopolystoma xenopodis]
MSQTFRVPLYSAPSLLGSSKDSESLGHSFPKATTYEVATSYFANTLEPPASWKESGGGGILARRLAAAPPYPVAVAASLGCGRLGLIANRAYLTSRLKAAKKLGAVKRNERKSGSEASGGLRRESPIPSDLRNLRLPIGLQPFGNWLMRDRHDNRPTWLLGAAEDGWPSLPNWTSSAVPEGRYNTELSQNDTQKVTFYPLAHGYYKK